MVQTLYVARHGMRANADPPPTGIDGDPRLTPEGALQARELGAHVGDAARLGGDRVTAIYSSPFYRCLETAAPASERLGVPVFVEPGLGEYYTTARPTKPVPWPAARSADVFGTLDVAYAPLVAVSPAGETRTGLAARVARALEAIFAHAAARGHSTVLIVTHAAVKIVIGEVLTGITVRAGTCSLDKYVRAAGDAASGDAASNSTWRCVLQGETGFLSGGEQMHWSFDMAHEAGSAADEASRAGALPAAAGAAATGSSNGVDSASLSAAAGPSTDGDVVRTLVSLDLSGLAAEDLPVDTDPANMVFACLHTDRPRVQIGDRLYEGEWLRTVGTDVFTSTGGQALGVSRQRIKLVRAEIKPEQRSTRNLVQRLKEFDAGRS